MNRIFPSKSQPKMLPWSKSPCLPRRRHRQNQMLQREGRYELSYVCMLYLFDKQLAIKLPDHDYLMDE
jgi:hypothetical protein